MYSVRAGNGRIYPLERETIVDLLTNTLKKDCYVKKENRTVYRLWCPSCGLPVRISNVFSDKRPYASHWDDGSEDSKDFDNRFKKCPLAKPTKFDIRARVSSQTQEIKEIYEIIYRYFENSRNIYKHSFCSTTFGRCFEEQAALLFLPNKRNIALDFCPWYDPILFGWQKS